MTKFSRIATVQFAVAGTDQTVTVSDLPYVWDDAAGPIEQQAVFDACNHLRSIGVQRGLSVICVETRPAISLSPRLTDCPECGGVGIRAFEHECDGIIEEYETKCGNCGGAGKITKTEADNA
jgi:hypothetical protein